MPATAAILDIFLIGISIVKVGIGVASVEGIKVASKGLNLKTPANLKSVNGAVNATAPFIKLP